MPTAYGAEFRQDVADVAREGEAPLAQIAKDFGLSGTTLKRWIAIAERKETGAGPAPAESAEMRELKKRNRLLEQENEILRRAAAYLARDINPGDGVLPVRRPRPMQEVKIEVVDTELGGTGLESAQCVTDPVIGHPQLRREEQVRAIDSRVTNALTDIALVEVSRCSVD